MLGCFFFLFQLEICLQLLSLRCINNSFSYVVGSLRTCAAEWCFHRSPSHLPHELSSAQPYFIHPPQLMFGVRAWALGPRFSGFWFLQPCEVPDTFEPELPEVHSLTLVLNLCKKTCSNDDPLKYLVLYFI